jgi:integrase
MPGSVKKEGSTWYYVFGYYDNGKRRQKKKRGFKTKKEAEKALVEALNALNNQSYVEPSNLTYKEFLQDWFKTKKNNIGVQTANVYEEYLKNRIIPSLGNFKLNKLKTIHIQNYVNELKEEGLASATIKKIFEIIRNSLEYAVDFNLIQTNVAKKVKLPKIEKKEMSVWDIEDVKKFLEVAKQDQNYIAFHLAITTGMRQGEILGLRWKDIDFDKGVLYVRQTLSRDGKTLLTGAKTKSSLRTIRLSDNTLEALKEHKNKISKIKEELGDSYQDYGLVVCTRIGTPIYPRNLRRTLNRLIERAKVPKIRFHDLRHTHATLLLSQGVNVKVISERLGHSNIKITLDTYSHVLPTMQEEAIKTIDHIIC